MKAFFKKIISAIMQLEARLVLAKYKPKIIAVTGSVGKTSTKDAIFSVMSDSFFIRKSEKSFNNDIGIPLTILGCENAWTDPILWLRNIWKGLALILFPAKYPAWLVLEVGASRPNDIKKIAAWLTPDIVVITAFAKVPVHVEFFSNRDALIREKQYLAEALKHDGILIVNGDDDDVMRIKEKSKNISVIYGTDSVSDLVASDYHLYYEQEKVAGVTFKVAYQENSIPIVMHGSLGMQNVYSALAAIAVGLTQKINIVKAGEALLNHLTPPGRMRILSGEKNTIIIDDTYNSSPVALASALTALTAIEIKTRKIAVLGDMLELGKHTMEEHYEAGKRAAASVDILITVGIRSRKIAEGALDFEMDEKNIYQCDDSYEAGKLLQDLIQERDIILVKGSQFMRLERVVKAIMAEPEKAGELLVRQDAEWEKRYHKK